MDRIDSSKHIRKWCLATNFKVLCRRGSCQDGWKDIGGILVNEVPEACREGSQRVVSFWNARSLTSPSSCSQEYRKPTPISHTFFLSVSASPSDPKWRSLSRVWLFVTPWTIHGILQARIPEWVAFPFSRGSSQPRDRTQVSCIAGKFFTSWATREAQKHWSG